MNVTELIETTNRLCINHSNLTDKEKETYLSFLNLANKDLYKVASKGLKTITERKRVFLNSVTGAFNLPANLYNIRKVFAGTTALAMSNIDEEITQLKGYLVEKSSLYCDLTNKYFTLPSAADPDDGNTVKRYITLVYCANPLKLVETVNDPTTEINIPIYPEPYHHFLVDGALYYFYLANRVFLEKRDDIRQRWKDDLQELSDFKNYGL